MKERRLFPPQVPHGVIPSRNRLQPEYPTDADLILLCSFQDFDGEQNGSQLRDSLTAEGFREPLARYLIRSSAILDRVSRGRYRLRRSPLSAGNQPSPAPLPVDEDVDKSSR